MSCVQKDQRIGSFMTATSVGGRKGEGGGGGALLRVVAGHVLAFLNASVPSIVETKQKLFLFFKRNYVPFFFFFLDEVPT